MVTLILIAMAIVALAAVVVTPIIMNLVSLGPIEQTVVELSRWVIAGAALIVGLGVIFRYVTQPAGGQGALGVARRAGGHRDLGAGELRLLASTSPTSGATTRSTARSAPGWRS